MDEYQLSEYDASLLVADKEVSEFFETAAKKANNQAKIAANWVLGELSAQLNKDNLSLSECPVNADDFGLLLLRIVDNTISGKIAKEVFQAMWQKEGNADEIIDKKGLKQVTDTGAIEALVDEVIANNPSQVEEFKAGKTKMMGYLVGQIMKASKGKANPQQVNQLLSKKLSQ